MEKTDCARTQRSHLLIRAWHTISMAAQARAIACWRSTPNRNGVSALWWLRLSRFPPNIASRAAVNLVFTQRRRLGACRQDSLRCNLRCSSPGIRRKAGDTQATKQLHCDGDALQSRWRCGGAVFWVSEERPSFGLICAGASRLLQQHGLLHGLSCSIHP